MADSNFLCTDCRRLLCEDCLSVADEYAELLHNARMQESVGTHKLKTLQRELDDANRRAKMWEEMSKIGLNEVITQWMDERVAKMTKVDERLTANDATIKRLRTKGM